MTIAGHSPSGNNCWETPDKEFQQWNRLFNFTLDVCAEHATAKCQKYFTIEDDGLEQDWSQSRCWMNPPYGRGHKLPWCRKAYEESQKGALVVGLLPVDCSTEWWEYVAKADYRFEYPYRIHFLNNGVPIPRTNFCSIIAIWGLNPVKHQGVEK